MLSLDLDPRQESELLKLVSLADGRDSYNFRFVRTGDGGATRGNLNFVNPTSAAISFDAQDLFAFKKAGAIDLPIATSGQSEGRLKRAIVDAVRSARSYSQGGAMGLNPAQTSLAQKLAERYSKSQFEFAWFPPAYGDSTGEVSFQDGAEGKPSSRADLMVLEECGFVTLLVDADSGTIAGTIRPQIIRAVQSGFAIAPSAVTSHATHIHVENVNTGGGGFQVSGHQSEQTLTTTNAGDNPAMLAQLVALTAELIGAMKTALPIEQHDAAAREAQDLVNELHKEKPDLITVENKARGVWQRLGTGLVSFADGAGKVADAVAKFAPWLAAVGAVAKSMMH